MSDGLPKEAKQHWRLTKNDRDGNTRIMGYGLRVQGSRPAKFGCQPIKLELYPHVHTYTANYVRVHFRPLGYIKRVE